MARRTPRQRWWFGVIIAVLAPLLAAGAAVAGAAEAPVGVIAAVTFAGGLVVAASGVRTEWRERRSEREALARDLSPLLRTPTPVPRVREVDPYAQLGVFRSTLADQATAEGKRPRYVEYDNDAELHEKITDPAVGMVLVRGEASVGKKRSAYEALARCWPKRPIVVPSRPSPSMPVVLSRLAELDVPMNGDGPPILWLDNAEWWASVGDLEVGLANLRTRYPGLLVVATLRFGAVPDAASATTTTDLLEARRADTVWRSLEALPWVAGHVLESGLSDRALRDFGAAYPDYADRMRQAGGIGAFFSGLDQLRRKLREGQGPTGHSPIGVALVRAAVDWRRSGLSRPAPDAVLRYLVRQERGRIADLGFEEALTWVTTPVDSGARLLDPVEVEGDIGYRVTDGIYDDLAVNRGHPATELDVVTRVGAAASSVLGPHHPHTLTTRHNIAAWTGQTGKPADALRLYNELLPHLQRVLGPHHPDTLTTRANIAGWTGHSGDPADALRLYTELLPDLQRVLGPHHPHTLTIRANIAHWTGHTGDPAEALRLHTQLLPDQQRLLGPDHPGTLATRSNIASWTGRTGDPAEALRLHIDLLTDQQRVLGPHHPDTLTTRSNIASWTGHTGDPAEALRLHTQLLPDQQRLLGPHHPHTLTTRSNIAAFTGRTGDPAEALRLHTQLLRDQQRLLGPHHPDTLTTRANIAAWTGRTGNPADALRLLTELLPDRERVLGPHHPDTLTTRHNIAHWTGRTGNPADALRLHTQLLPDLQQVLGSGHHLTRAVADQIERLRRELTDRD